MAGRTVAAALLLAALQPALATARPRPSFIGTAQPGVRVFGEDCFSLGRCPPCPSSTKPTCCNADCETVVFNFSGAPGYMSHLWLAAGTTAGATLENTTARYYVDGERTASIAFDVLLGHSIGWLA
jgi:hypothetical protein